ncbi:hypothetical protein F4823DRAFT_592812 [Ustulina deusta]|nr:hypothetical protein F4823DRAFT_592812 [Ustulina deusta]
MVFSLFFLFLLLSSFFTNTGTWELSKSPSFHLSKVIPNTNAECRDQHSKEGHKVSLTNPPFSEIPVAQFPSGSVSLGSDGSGTDRSAPIRTHLLIWLLGGDPEVPMPSPFPPCAHVRSFSLWGRQLRLKTMTFFSRICLGAGSLSMRRDIFGVLRSYLRRCRRKKKDLFVNANIDI